MRATEKTVFFFAILLFAFLLTIAVSLSGIGNREVLVSINALRITVTAAGAGLAVIITAVFEEIRILGVQRRIRKTIYMGDRADGIGFGLLPGLIVWKIFEQGTNAGLGKSSFSPLDNLPWITEEGFFMPCRIEIVAAVICFAGIVLWLMLRRKDLSGNGDLLLSVLCVLGSIRCVTEFFRAEPWIHAGNFTLVIPFFCIMNWVCLIMWAVRRDRLQKNLLMDLVEILGAILCTSGILLISMRIITIGNNVADLIVLSAAAFIMAVLTLAAGMDARKLKEAAQTDFGGYR